MNDSDSRDAREPGNVQSELLGEPQRGPAETSVLRKIFVGADGLRAGWSLLIFLVILGLLLGGVTSIAQRMHVLPAKGQSVGEIAPSFGLYAEGLPFLMVFVATWIMSKIEKRPNGVYGLGGPRVLGNFLGGLAWGVTCLSLLVFTLWKSGLLVVDRRLLFGAGAWRYGIIWLFAFLMVGLLEEYMTRGYLLFTLSRGLAGVYSWMIKSPHNKAAGFWTAAILLSTLFGLGHRQNAGESPIGLFAAGLAGLVFCLSLWRTGSLWWAIGFHTSWDWAQSYLYGVADSGVMVQHHLLATHPLGKALMSGGATGPEGSVFVLMVLALVVGIVMFTLPRGRYGATA
ncbi:MAG TPA: CPBP family intramembrane glutamic endopeptidase [Verrucomicrobiae bacterium]|nr:CPBP family intramembrane glutamic endopeptidase [Verrucomicrobiae bacterium]